MANLIEVLKVATFVVVDLLDKWNTEPPMKRRV